MNNIMLMCGDVEVLEFNFNEGYYHLYSKDLLPMPLKGRLAFERSYTNAVKNYNAIVSWLGNRTLLLSRSNAKKIYNALNIAQEDTPENKARISITCRAVSVLDNYWLRISGDNTTWKGVNIRKNPLNETIAQIALHGSSITVEGSLVSPELSTDGVYPKAWRRHEDGSLWLYKADQVIQGKTLVEVMCSNILDKTNAQHCHYESTIDQGLQVCRCKVLTDDKHSIIPAYDYLRYCKNNNIDFIKNIMQIDKDAIYKMCIVDYLIANNDRHSRNWGFLYRPDNHNIIGCHPLFDHNNAFDIEWLKNRDTQYRFNKRSMRDTAKSAMEDVDFHFTSEITRDDFLTDEQYEEFMWRADDLGITVKSDYTDSIIALLNKHLISLHISEVKSLLPKQELPLGLLEDCILKL